MSPIKKGDPSPVLTWVIIEKIETTRFSGRFFNYRVEGKDRENHVPEKAFWVNMSALLVSGQDVHIEYEKKEGVKP